MDDLLQLTGRALRLPFFVVGLVALTAYTVVAGAVCVLWLLIVLPALWFVVGIPMEFLSAAFSGGSSEQLKRDLQATVADWRSMLDRTPAYFGGLFDRLGRWFLIGSRS
ncbi:MAG TPA: hypothetical protein VFF79_16265 [Conexibacter sp.]|jgi:hypothetical protein|nr:hypothetical protein [Conexibacter sp.]